MYVDNLDMLKDSIDNICSKKVSGNVKFIVESATVMYKGQWARLYNMSTIHYMLSCGMGTLLSKHVAKRNS